MCIFVGVVKEMWERQHGKQVRGGGHGMGENGNGGTIIMRRLGILIAAVAAAALTREVRKEGHRMLAGTVGSRSVPRALAENGYPEDAFEMFIQPEYPGWGNLVRRGATSLWELWNGRCSRNHGSFADVAAWSYRYLAGFSPAGPGFRRIRLKPCPVPQLESFHAEHLTPHGMLRGGWKREDGKVIFRFRIPEGCSADLILPGGEEYASISGNIETAVADPAGSKA